MPVQIFKDLPERENTIYIILTPDGNGGYLPKGEILPDKADGFDVWIERNSRKNKIKYMLFAKTDKGFKKIKKRDIDLEIDFKEPDDAVGTGFSSKPSKWCDGSNKQKLKANKRFIVIRKGMHKDNDCYNYDIWVVLNNGQPKIEIDPWLRIRHRT